jgi:hypothetical protein
MINNIDFIYEYSDLNLFKTRCKVLSGHYTDLVLEFGGSVLEQGPNGNRFIFESELFTIPESLSAYQLKGTPDFEQFLSDLLIAIIIDRRNDPDMKAKLDATASNAGPTKCIIEIDTKYYPQVI